VLILLEWPIIVKCRTVYINVEYRVCSVFVQIFKLYGIWCLITLLYHEQQRIIYDYNNNYSTLGARDSIKMLTQLLAHLNTEKLWLQIKYKLEGTSTMRIDAVLSLHSACLQEMKQQECINLIYSSFYSIV